MTARATSDFNRQDQARPELNRPLMDEPSGESVSSEVTMHIERSFGNTLAVNTTAAHIGEQILVVDDDLYACKLVAFLLGEAGYRVVTVADSAPIAPLLAERDFDLVVLDIMLPEMNGFDICRQIRQASHVPIIFVSGYANIENRVAGLRGGGDDFLAKPFEPAELLARVEAVLRRRRPSRILHGTQFTAHGLTLDPTEQMVIGSAGRPIPLTHIETQLLHYFMAYAGSVLTTQQICQTLWGAETADIQSRMQMHIYRLRRKIEQPSEHVYYITTIRNVGYLFEQRSKR
ncbi:MAG: response regulator transcription factor [Roseiflexaceae bacterium]